MFLYVYITKERLVFGDKYFQAWIVLDELLLVLIHAILVFDDILMEGIFVFDLLLMERITMDGKVWKTGWQGVLILYQTSLLIFLPLLRLNF